MEKTNMPVIYELKYNVGDKINRNESRRNWNDCIYWNASRIK